MAVWQATFHFLSAARFPTDYRERLSVILPRLPSWSPDLELWGVEDGNRIDVWTDDSRPSEAHVRFDLRELSEPFCLAIARFASDAQTAFRAENGLEVPAHPVELIAALESSRAARFVEHPERYFNRLRVGGLEDV